MKAALCLAGHFRTFDFCKDSLFANLISKYNPDVFIHTWDTLGFGRNGTDAGSVNAEKWTGKEDYELISRYSSIGNSATEFYRNSPTLTEDCYKCLNPKGVVVEKYEDVEKMIVELASSIKNKNHYDYPISLISFSRKKFLCKQLKCQYEEKNDFKYDIVFFARPDVQYFEPVVLNDSFSEVIITPEAVSYGCISDIFAYSTSEKMDRYFSIFELIPLYNDQKVCFNPHELLKIHLDKVNVGFLIDQNLKIDLNKDLKSC